jgi:hypothetical protein
MRLRITSGPSADRTLTGEPGFRTLLQSPTIVVEGSAKVRDLPIGDGYRLLIAGTIEGWRTAANELLAQEPALAAAGQAARDGIERVRAGLEGRYIAVLVRPDGAAELTANQFGQLDIYCQQTNGHWVFASDMSLLGIAKQTPSFDQAALAHTWLIHERRPPKRHTLYEQARRLGVGEYVRIADGRVEFVQSNFQPAASGTIGDRELNEYADLMLDAVKRRGSRDGNVVYLSSGWDSTAILGCLVHLFGRQKVRAVIGRMQYAERSGVINRFEIDRATAVAAFYGVPLETVEFSYKDRGPEILERARPLMRAHQLSSGVGLNHWQLAEHTARTSRGGEAVFAGEISDGAHNLGFSQFVTMMHPVQEFREYADKMGSYLFGPTFLHSFQTNGFADDSVYKLRREHTGGVYDAPSAATGSARSKQMLASLFLRPTRLPLWSLENRKVLTAAGRQLYSSTMEATYLQEAADGLTPETAYSWYLRLYNSFHWQGSTVTPLWVTADAHDLQMRLPFWDSRIQDFLSVMPENGGRGLDLNPTKYPLKWMLKHRIAYPYHLQVGPHSYTYDVVPGFSLAAELLYASSFHPLFVESVKPRPYHQILSPEVFDLPYLDGVVDRYVAGTEVRGAELADLGVLCWLCAVGWYGQ